MARKARAALGSSVAREPRRARWDRLLRPKRPAAAALLLRKIVAKPRVEFLGSPHVPNLGRRGVGAPRRTGPDPQRPPPQPAIPSQGASRARLGPVLAHARDDRRVSATHRRLAGALACQRDCHERGTPKIPRWAAC